MHDEQLSIIPKEFYIANMIDERDDRAAVAWLLPASPNGKSPSAKTYPIDLHGGGLAAIRHFIDRNLPHNAALRPITVSLKKFMATETASAGSSVEGQVVVSLSFSLVQDDELKHLIDYNGAAKYTRTAGPPQEIEPTLRHMIENGIKYFDRWMNNQAATDIALAKSVKVTFTDHNEKPEGDTIYYSANRPVTWDDFKGKTPQSRYAAEVYPTIGYEEHVEVNNAVIIVALDIKVCLPKSACWVLAGSQSDYTLNHEQRHFDIAKIAAEHFKQRIKSEKLPVTNYDGYINVDYLDAYREMDTLQKQYDNETAHGTDRVAQERWNKKIDKGLRLKTGD